MCFQSIYIYIYIYIYSRENFRTKSHKNFDSSFVFRSSTDEEL